VSGMGEGKGEEEGEDGLCINTRSSPMDVGAARHLAQSPAAMWARAQGLDASALVGVVWVCGLSRPGRYCGQRVLVMCILAVGYLRADMRDSLPSSRSFSINGIIHGACGHPARGKGPEAANLSERRRLMDERLEGMQTAQWAVCMLGMVARCGACGKLMENERADAHSCSSDSARRWNGERGRGEYIPVC